MNPLTRLDVVPWGRTKGRRSLHRRKRQVNSEEAFRI